MLEAARSARLVSFDLADFRWAHRADELVRQHYGRRRFPGVVFGDSSLTVATLKDAAAAAAASTGDVPLVKMDGFEGDDAARLPKSDKQYLQRHTRSGIIPQALAQAIGPPLHCDAGFIDGAKTFTGRLRHILSMRSVSSPGTVVFMDEVTSKECCDGTFGDGDEHAARCKPLNEGYYDATRAYSHAAKRGLLKVVECDWPMATMLRMGCACELGNGPLVTSPRCMGSVLQSRKVPDTTHCELSAEARIDACTNAEARSRRRLVALRRARSARRRAEKEHGLVPFNAAARRFSRQSRRRRRAVVSRKRY